MNGLNLKNYLIMMAALCLVLAIMYGLSFLLQKTKILPMLQNKKMNVVSVLSLNFKQKVIVIDAFDKKILLGVSPNSINFLTEITDEKSFQKELVDEQKNM